MFGKRKNVVVGTAYVVVLLVLLATYLLGDLAQLPNFLVKLGILILVASAAFLLTSLRFFGQDKTRRLCINLAITGVVLAASVAMAEFATRHVYRDVTASSIGCGYFNHRWKEIFPPRINRWGFRERDFSVTPQEGVYRIAVIGDSITYGKAIVEDERMTNLIEQRLNEEGGGYEVLNFGLSGAATFDHIQFLRDVVLDIEPDFILLQWYVNDVEGPERFSERPPLIRLAPSYVLHSILLENSAFYCLGQMAWIQIWANLDPAAASYQAYLVERFADPDSPASKATATALTTFIELVRERGIPMGITLYPDGSFLRSAGGPYALAYLHDRVLEACTRYGLPCLDLRPSFAAVEDWRSLELSVFDGHPSARRHRIMADAVLAFFGETWSTARRGAAN